MPRPLKEIAEMKGVGPKLLFAVDTESKPGKQIIHFVRFETMEFDSELIEDIVFQTIDPSHDSRLLHLADCITTE